MRFFTHLIRVVFYMTRGNLSMLMPIWRLFRQVELRDLLAGGLIMPEASSPQDFDASVVPNLQAAVHLVAAKDPAWADALKQVVLTAVQQVAEASKGVTAEEQSAVDRIREGLA